MAPASRPNAKRQRRADTPPFVEAATINSTMEVDQASAQGKVSSMAEFPLDGYSSDSLAELLADEDANDSYADSSVDEDADDQYA